MSPKTMQCPSCATEVDASAPLGLCPRCLMEAAVAPPSSASSARPFTAPAVDALAHSFPDHEVLELLGQGGMGAVYKAVHRKLERLEAIKILPRERASDPSFEERFLREARALARLSHPNLIAVHDFGERDGLFYLTMEFVDGPNLRQLLQRGCLAAERALGVVPQICDALQYAHKQGVVHRDIKPENILIDESGRVRIADFGLARIAEPERAHPSLTLSHQALGTPHYMAPEQLEQPESVDHRADIYSLGVVFYEMLTGKLPLGRFAPPSQRAQVGRAVDQIVLRSLEAEPARRWPDAASMKGAVEELREDAPPAQTTPQIGTFAGGRPRRPGRHKRRQRHHRHGHSARRHKRHSARAKADTPERMRSRSWHLLVAGLVAILGGFLPWGHFVATPTSATLSGEPFLGMLGPQRFTISGLEGTLTILGVRMPTWILFVIAASLVAMAALSLHQRRPLHRGMAATVSATGLILTLFILTIFLFPEEATLGLGSIVLLLAYASALLVVLKTPRMQQG